MVCLALRAARWVNNKINNANEAIFRNNINNKNTKLIMITTYFVHENSELVSLTPHEKSELITGVTAGSCQVKGLTYMLYRCFLLD